MTKKDFSKGIAGCSVSMWRAVLSGDRNLGYKRAKLVSMALNTSSDIWQDAGFTKERKAAWENYTNPEAKK